MAIQSSQELADLYAKSDSATREKIDQLLGKTSPPLIPINPSLTISEADTIPLQDDRANRRELVKQIASEIVSSSFNTLSLEGTWGSGKTVSLHWVYDELKENHSNSVIPIWLDLWKYEATGNVLLPIVDQLRTLASGHDFDERAKKVIAGLLILGGTAAATAALGPIALTLTAPLLTKAEILKLLFKKRDTLQDQLSNIQHLHDEFEKLVAYLLDGRTSHPNKIVYLVDDLDRCLPGNVILILESLKNFLGTPNTSFLLAIDRRVVAHAISQKYGSEAIIDGDAYLDKVINFSFELPFQTDAIVRNVWTDFTHAFPSLSGLSIEFVPALLVASRTTSVRSIKRIFNRFRKLYEYSNPEFGASIDYRYLFLLALIHELYPAFYSDINIHTDSDFTEQFNILRNNPESNAGKNLLATQRGLFLRNIIAVTSLPHVIAVFSKAIQADRPNERPNQRLLDVLKQVRKYGI
jgi:hypothetical protein